MRYILLALKMAIKLITDAMYEYNAAADLDESGGRLASLRRDFRRRSAPAYKLTHRYL